MSMEKGPTPDQVGASPENNEQRMDNLMSHVKAEIMAGRIDPKRLENLFIQDTNPVERPFKDGSSLFGYNQVVELGGEIVSIKGEKGDLFKGMKVELVGDSRGYVPSGHQSGEKVTIVGFSEPFEKGESDHVIMVSGGGKTGMVKPSNINLGE
ncbi:MAG: hypothetical protein HZC03_01020 [Candidatus Lloydbacteria bacterium]|nr:hypothetical protein [Candidatus Lloydbacteria bacterium]